MPGNRPLLDVAHSERIEGSITSLSQHRLLGSLVRFCVRRREQILYLVVGVWNTLFGYAVWALLYYLLRAHLHYLVIQVISWPAAVANAYIGFRWVVFRSKGSIWGELPRFSLVYLVGLALSLMVLPILVRTLPLNLYVIQAMFTAAVVVLTYLGHKYFSFRASRKAHVKDCE